ncbi:Sphingosine-1-phosphate lyase [Camellia lanceoleosa]|nr:Sphingosine-1-phosphate lyase [Camellia lanceoleosa]
MDVFQSVAWHEAEVVAMTVALLGGKEKASGGHICGNMTSGGTGRACRNSFWFRGCFHVDLCLRGFVLPFARNRKLGICAIVVFPP